MFYDDFVLWGFKAPHHPECIKLSSGTLRDCRGSLKRYQAAGGWTLGIYKSGSEPMGLLIEHSQSVRRRQEDTQTAQAEHEDAERWDGMG